VVLKYYGLSSVGQELLDPFKGQTSYTLHEHTLDVVDSGKYLGVTINKDLTWTKHLNQTIGKASKTLGFLRRNLQRCTSLLHLGSS
jgi:hypothetical protein